MENVVDALQVPLCLLVGESEITNFFLSRRFATLRTAVILINGFATLVAVGFLADGIPPLAHEIRSERDAQADAAIETFLASLTPDEKRRLYRLLSSTELAFASLHGDDANDNAVAEKFLAFWEPFQSYRTRVKFWRHALYDAPYDSSAIEMWIALILLAVVAMSSLALRVCARDVEPERRDR